MEWNAEQVLDDVSKAASELVLNEPFYGHFFVGMLKEVHERIQTMAIGPSGNNVKLHINPIFWKTQLTNLQLQVGLVKHEVLHVLFKHIFRGKDYAQKDIFNIACDLVVNQCIATNALPPNRIHLGLFPGIGLSPDRDADEYYRKLCALKEKFEQLASQAEKDGESSPSPSPNESGREAWENLKGMLGQGNEWQEKHGLWVELDQLPAALREILEQQINESLVQSLERIRNNSQDWGALPASLRQHLQAFDAERKSVVNWRRLLRLFSESSSRTFIRNTMRRASKRYGTSPGIKVKKRQKMLVAIDTSGSISQEDINEFFGEIFHIWKRGAEVMVVECDTQIAAQYVYQGKIPEATHGGGGTHFEAPILFANAQYHPDAIVYFTDGFGPLPQVRSRCPILWMVSKAGCTAGPAHMQTFPGLKAHMHPLDLG